MEAVKTRSRHIYSLDTMDGVPNERCSAEITPRKPFPGAALASGRAASQGAVVRGERVQVALVHRARGSGSAPRANVNEQFTFVLGGTLVADIDGQLVRVPRGHVLHVPAGMPCGHAATADEDAVFYVMQDTRAPFDGFPAEGSTNVSAGAQPRTRNGAGSKVQYVYDIVNLDKVPDTPTSAQVIPKNFISKKSSSFGAALRGDRLQVGHIHKGVGSGTKLHTHPNEQFSFVLEGTMIYEIGGATIEAPPFSATHIPHGMQHSAIASAAGDVLTFVVKDTSHGMSGPPVDGIEDGPIYLPGFDPRKK
jgi:quercetin dioxygenase-like cupin family protein